MNRTFNIIVLIFLSTVSVFKSEAQINTEQLMRIGANSQFFEDYVVAIQYYNQAISINPGQARPYFYRSIAKLNLEDYIGAENDATSAIERNPFIIDAYEVRAIARQNQGKNRSAIEDYNKILESQPPSAGILFNKALAQYDIKDTIGASETFETLIKKFPRYENAYIGRARLRLERQDTIGAKEDIETALKINSNTLNAYILRADIKVKSEESYSEALSDMDMAIKIEPNSAGLYINRAYVRYLNEDYKGAFDDYDKAIELEPFNGIAIMNRGLLRAEVHDNNLAIKDFTSVLELNPNDYKTLYNRAILLAETGDYTGAINDISKVIDAFPDFAAAYFLRFDIKRRKGDMRSAKADYDRSMSLAKKKVALHQNKNSFISPLDNRDDSSDSDAIAEYEEIEGVKYETQEQVKQRFTSLTTLSDNFYGSVETSSDNDIRGKVQNKDLKFDLEPYFLLTYYTSPTEIKNGSEYIREVDEINSSHLLKFGLQVANRESNLNESENQMVHRSSIEYYNSYISSHTPRTIDYFGRAMDFMTIRDYAKAIADLDRAISLTPDFTLAYLLRAQARYLSSLKDNNKNGLEQALYDLNKAGLLSPRLPIIAFNRGIILSELGRKEDAIESFSNAIALKQNFGEAYFNRGYEYLSIGEAAKAFPDLSRAGELGVVPAYSLLKHMGAN